MKKREYSKNIANVINGFLTDDDWHFSFDEQMGVFTFGFSCRGKLKTLKYHIRVRDDDYLVYTTSPLGAEVTDKAMMASMAEFICRVNYGLISGNFELDLRDGEIRYKSYVDCEGITPSKEMIINSIYCPAAMFDLYGSGIVDIIFAASSAEDAMAKCEGTNSPHSPVSETSDDNEESSTDDPVHLKTNLFGTEGADD